ncbi:hypothetical protein JXQ31_14190 [candidate division KSB1 bacterium]|nr:hypothetical protein [candidate division KSB1 bacterium]
MSHRPILHHNNPPQDIYDTLTIANLPGDGHGVIGHLKVYHSWAVESVPPIYYGI